MSDGDYFSSNGAYYIWDSTTKTWDTSTQPPSSGNDLGSLNEGLTWYESDNRIYRLISLSPIPVLDTVHKYIFNIKCCYGIINNRGGIMENLLELATYEDEKSKAFVNGVLNALIKAVESDE